MADSPGRPPPSRDDFETALQSLYPVLTEARNANADVAAMVKALLETLVAAGLVRPEDYERRRRQALDKLLGRLQDRRLTETTRSEDKYNLKDLPQIDCAALMPICQGRCCRLKVCLAPEDLDERILSWDYAKPYQLRRRPSDGYCNYSDPQTHFCNAYEHRPAVCRSYDCRQDTRIWIDFDRRIPQPWVFGPVDP
jgi:hypothetical protein